MTTNRLGKLLGIGVGPGAPDLLTVRAVDRLKGADVLAIPRSNRHADSVAWRIAGPAVGEVEGQIRMHLDFPMTKDPTRLRPAWDEAFARIGEHLHAGRDVAFLTVGDPFVYSTFIYLFREAPERWPGLEIEVVPGVSSISAVPAVAAMPIADGQERIAVIPASYATEDLVDILENFDTTILMKVSSVMPEVVDALERTGLMDRAVYVSKATTDQENIVRDLASIANDKCDYFSMVVVTRGDRSGLLAGESELRVAGGGK